MQVYINTRQRAQFKRKYPPLHTADLVRTAVKAGSFKQKVIIVHGLKMFIQSRVLKTIRI